MAALPYMQLYVAEYLADTTHLNAEQHGAYLLLLMNYWQRGKPLPDVNDRLAIVARSLPDRWNELRTVLAEFFEITDGFWVHKRMERDLERVKGISDAGRAAGLASGKARREKTKNDRSTIVQKSLNETRTKHEPTEQNRTEQKKESDVISPEMVTRAVLTELALSGRDLAIVLEDVCGASASHFPSPADLRDALIKAYRDYDASKHRLSYTKGAAKFFGDGDWRNPAGWPWKQGEKAPDHQRPLTVAEKMARIA